MTAKRKGKASEGKAAMAYMRRLHGSDPATAPAVRGQRGMSDLLTLCAKLTARNPQLSTSWDKALEIELSEGGRVFFIANKAGDCACGITDDADPDMKKELDTELASRGLPLFIIDPEIENRPYDPSEASDGIEELARLSDLPLRQWRPANTRILTWPEGKLITPLKKKKKKKRKKNNNKRRGKNRLAPAMSALLDICARAALDTGTRAMELTMSDGVHVYFLSDEGGFCACGITDNADPELIKTLGAKLASLGLPLHSIAAEKAPEGMAEVKLLYRFGKLGL